MYVNCIQTKNKKVRAVCQCCGKKSQAITPDDDGEPSLWYLASGWSIAPLPADFKHKDGSMGSTYSCPSCNKKLKQGQRLKLRDY